MYGFDELVKLTSPVSAIKEGVRRIQEAPADIANAFKGGVSQVQQGAGKIQRPERTLGGTVSGLEGGLQIGSGIASIATSPLAPLYKPVGEIVKVGTDRVAAIPAVQKFAMSKTGQNTARVAESLANAGNIAGTILGVNKLAKAAPKIGADFRNEFMNLRGNPDASRITARFDGPKGDTFNTLDMYDKYSKSGDMQVYSDPVNKVFKPEIARQIIKNTQTSLMADKIPNAEYLAQRFGEMLDANHMTAADVINAGKKLIQ